MSAALKEQGRARPRLQAELFENNASLGSYVTEGEDKVIIGSSNRADLVVPHASVSQIHAMLRILDNKDILLYDLGSEKGTFVSGAKIVEHKLAPGAIFEIGGHKVKVNIIDNPNSSQTDERALFWKNQCTSAPDHLELVRLEEGMVRDEKTLGRAGRVFFGIRKNELPIEGGKRGDKFIGRKDSGGQSSVECYLPVGYRADIYDGNNELIRVFEDCGKVFNFNPQEKVRLVNPDETKEILLFWRAQGLRTGRKGKDAENPVFQRALLVCGAIAFLFLGIASYVPLKKEVIEEATIPKTSYFRLSMESAPAREKAEEAAGSASQAKEQAQPQASKAASISSSLSKLLTKKSSLTADNIEQAISNNGTQTVRMNNVKNANIKSEQIAAGAVGGGSVNVNAISAGLSGGSGGKAGSLNGFANGKGASIGGGTSGFGGKGFDMSLGGDEAEAIGGLDKALIAAVVQANIGQIKHCYERQLIVDPNIFGKVVAQWTIDKDGLVNSNAIKKSTMNNKPVENCILAKIKGWNFPKPKGGGQVIVSYPFLFKSLN